MGASSKVLNYEPRALGISDCGWNLGARPGRVQRRYHTVHEGIQRRRVLHAYVGPSAQGTTRQGDLPETMRSINGVCRMPKDHINAPAVHSMS